jgi:Zn-finger nucleic acid-binding protein
MKCPHDGTTLATVEILGLELDKCHKCDGIWCDRGELERLRDAKVEGIEEVLERKYGDPEYEEGSVDDYMRCPRCEGGRLLRHHYTYVNPVAIDRCERCHGIWLDDGELNTIIGEKKTIDRVEDPGRLKTFLKALAKLVGREED